MTHLFKTLALAAGLAVTALSLQGCLAAAAAGGGAAAGATGGYQAKKHGYSAQSPVKKDDDGQTSQHTQATQDDNGQTVPAEPPE